MSRGWPLLLLLAGCPRPPASDAIDTPATPPGQLTILHTNDLHSHFLPEAAEWLDGKPPIGGMVRLDAEVDALRAARGRASTLLLDGGDILTGTPLSDITVDGAQGGAMVAFLEGLDYDAWVIGNHEFDKGLDNLVKLTSLSDVPVLSANLRATDGVSALLPRQEFSRIFEVNGVKVGVIGVTTEQLGTLMNKRDFGRLVLQRVAAAVQTEVDLLDPKTDLLVVLSHIGVDADEALARQVHGVDLIVGGHSHTRIVEAQKVEGTWIVQAGSYTRCLGVVDLVVQDDAISSFRYELRDLMPATVPGPASPEVEAMVTTYSGQIDAAYKVEVSTSPAGLSRDSHHPSPLGRWTTDMLRAEAGTDVAVYNAGGLRADIDAGPVLTGELFAVFPFGNEVVVGQLSGSDLMGIVIANASAEAFEKRSFIQVSGLTWSWRMNRGAPEIVEVKVAGKPLDPARLYTVATNSYVAEQWEKTLGAPLRDAVGLGLSDYNTAVAYARKAPVADPGDARATRLPDGR